MEQHDGSGDNKPFVQIKPADLTLSSSSSGADVVKEEKKAGKTFWMGVLIGGLTGLAMLVILLLPSAKAHRMCSRKCWIASFSWKKSR
jgi:hypothetical protein